MKRSLLLVLLLATVAISSCKEKIEDAITAASYKSIEFIVPDIPYYPDDAPSSKAALKTDPIGFQWEANDTVGIFPNQGSQVFFSMENGVGSNSASFDGGGWALKESSSYYSYFPLVGKFYLNPKSIPVSFEGQKQVSTTSPIGSTRFYLAASGVSNGSGGLTFSYNILNAILNVNCTLPAGVYTKLTLTTENDLFITEGRYNLFASNPAIVNTKKSSTISLDLEDLSLTEETVLPLYIMLAPVDLNGVTITVTVTESTGRKYVCEKTPSRPYLAGKRYGLTCNSFTEYAADYPEGVDSSDQDLGDDDEVITIN